MEPALDSIVQNDFESLWPLSTFMHIHGHAYMGRALFICRKDAIYMGPYIWNPYVATLVVPEWLKGQKPTGDSVTEDPETNPAIKASDTSILLAHEGRTKRSPP
jgi:hypothetical protein